MTKFVEALGVTGAETSKGSGEWNHTWNSSRHCMILGAVLESGDTEEYFDAWTNGRTLALEV